MTLTIDQLENLIEISRKRNKQLLELYEENRDLRIALTRAEQTIRNLGNAALTGDYRQIALNEAANLRATIGE